MNSLSGARLTAFTVISIPIPILILIIGDALAGLPSMPQSPIRPTHPRVSGALILSLPAGVPQLQATAQVRLPNGM